jgi:hypothetical protein
MFLQHQHEHPSVDDQAGVKQFHAGNLIANVRKHQLQRSCVIQPSVGAQWLRRVNVQNENNSEEVAPGRRRI